MRGISKKALLISNLAYFLFFSMAALLGYVVSLVTMHFLTNLGLAAIHESLRSSPFFNDALKAGSATFAALGAGYLAARISKASPQLNGALSSVAVIVLIVLPDIYMPAWTDSATLTSVIFRLPDYMSPILGILGACIAAFFGFDSDQSSTGACDNSARPNLFGN